MVGGTGEHRDGDGDEDHPEADEGHEHAGQHVGGGAAVRADA
jgi:hypothetical protein